jgi:hypothetical protein
MLLQAHTRAERACGVDNLNRREVDRLTSDILGSVTDCMAGLEIIANRDNMQRLTALRTRVRGQVEASHARAVPAVPSRMPSWLLAGFALSLLGGLMGFVGSAKSYEVAGRQAETVKRLDGLVRSGALERVEKASQQMGDAGLADRLNQIEAFQLRAAQAIRDLAELQEKTARLRQFE